ncbi:MAG: hypothetical protein ACYDBJ_01335 [Aggregatilineales bacterium]
MRIVTLDHIDTGWRVGYRWADDPLALPRLLVDSADVPLSRLRQMLERDFFGASMQPGVYQVIALVQGDSEAEAVRTAFAGLDVVGVPRDEQTLAVLSRSLEPEMPFDLVLALTYWQTTPPDFAVLFDQLDAGFIAPFSEFAANPVQMRADFASIRASISSALIGQSVRAMRELYAQLTGSAVHVPLTPSQALIHTDFFCGLPLNLIDLRAPNANFTLNGIPLLILAVTSDPGPGAIELSALAGAERAVIALVNAHASSADYAAMRDYVRAQIDSTIQVVDAEEIAAVGRTALGAIAHQRLFGWLETHFSEINAPDHVRESIGRVQRLIARVTG